MDDSTKTIDITPKFNMERIQAYADRNLTRDPQTHITARLEILSELSDLIDEMDEPSPTPMSRLELAQKNLEEIVAFITLRHRETSSELLGFFTGDSDD